MKAGLHMPQERRARGMANKNEAKIRFTAETEDFTQGIKNANSELSNIRAEMQLADAQFKNTGDSAEYMKTKQELLQQALEANRDKQEALSAKLEVAKQIYGDNSTEVANLQKQLTYAKVQEEDFKSQIMDTSSALDEQKKSAEDAGSSVDTMADVLVNAGVANIIKDIAGAAVELAENFDSASATIVEGTGASGEALDELNTSARQAFGAIADADADINSTSAVLAELNTRFGVTGDEATDLTVKISSFAQHTGTDGVSAVDGIADVMHRWSLDISDIGDLMDDLTTANQSCKLSVDGLTGYLTENSVAFQELGYGTQDALAMLISLSDGGANVGTVMSGMTKAVSNLSDVTSDVPGAFQSALTAMGECDSVSQALQAQVGDTGLTIEDVFGKKAAQELAINVQNGTMDIDRWTDALSNNSGALKTTGDDATTMQDSWSQAVNNVSMALGSTFTPAITSVVTNVAQVITKVSQVVAQSPVLQSVLTAVVVALGMLAGALAISSLISMVQKAFALLNVTMMANPVFLVVTAIAALAAGLVYAYKHCEGFKKAVDGAFTKIKNVATNVINFVKTNWKSLLLMIVNPFAGAFKLLYDNCSGFREFIDKFIQGIHDTISNIGAKIKDTATNIFDKVKDAVTHPIETAKDTIKSLTDKIKEIFDKLKIKLPEIKLPHFNISGGEAPWGIAGKGTKPTIDVEWYKSGAVLKKTTQFGTNTRTGAPMVGAEAGYETIAPIDVLQGYVASAVESAMSQAYIDYDELGECVARACAKLNLSIILDNREVGRVYRGSL